MDDPVIRRPRLFVMIMESCRNAATFRSGTLRIMLVAKYLPAVTKVVDLMRHRSVQQGQLVPSHSPLSSLRN